MLPDTLQAALADQGAHERMQLCTVNLHAFIRVDARPGVAGNGVAPFAGRDMTGNSAKHRIIRRKHILVQITLGNTFDALGVEFIAYLLIRVNAQV